MTIAFGSFLMYFLLWFHPYLHTLDWISLPFLPLFLDIFPACFFFLFHNFLTVLLILPFSSRIFSSTFFFFSFMLLFSFGRVVFSFFFFFHSFFLSRSTRYVLYFLSQFHFPSLLFLSPFSMNPLLDFVGFLTFFIYFLSFCNIIPSCTRFIAFWLSTVLYLSFPFFSWRLLDDFFVWFALILSYQCVSVDPFRAPHIIAFLSLFHFHPFYSFFSTRIHFLDI